MKRHGSLNRAYRLVWSEVRNAWVVAAETARGRGKGSGRTLVAAALSLSAGIGQAAPIGGQVVSGTGNISQSGATTTIKQSTQNLSLTWKSFNIAAQETVNFQQPSASSLAVNRIFDTNGTQIFGRLNANGQVWLINPNGVLFGQGAQVNVGGLVASTLNLNEATLNGNARSFSGNGTGSVINQGTINAATGGYVALLGNKVSNQGVITAKLGTVAFGAGSAATLTFSGNSLVQMQVDQSVLNSVAENGGLIRADGGMVVMTAGAKDSLLASVVNNTGIIEARTVEQHEGVIALLGGMQAGTVNVGGTLDASASSPLPQSGEGPGVRVANGGFIETSAARVNVANDAKVTTAASMGLAGTWLIDPVDFTIGAGGAAQSTSGIGASTLSTSLGSGNVSIATDASTAGNGDIFVNNVVSWAANKLTLSAHRNININANLNGSGTASLTLQYGQGAVTAGNTSDYALSNGAQVNLPTGDNFSTKLGSNGTTTAATVITSLGAQGSITGTVLQGMNGNLSGNYALGSNIDAAATSTWNVNAGFAPISTFTGTFDGLGHTISNLTINRPTTDLVGLFGNGSGSTIRNVGLVGGSVSGRNTVGVLVGLNFGTVSNSYATGNVSGASYVGGLVGSNYGNIGNSYATGSVSDTGVNAGGLTGYTSGSVSNSYATGSVSGTINVGGLVGRNNVGSVSNSYATGSVSGNASVGGLVGSNDGGGAVSNAFWDTTTSNKPTSSGGFGMATANMQQQANFTSATAANGNANPGWDFGNTWVMYNGFTYPLLRFFMTPLTVAANNVTTTYSGIAFSGGNGIACSGGACPGTHLFNTSSFTGSSQGARNVGGYVLTPAAYSDQQGYIISYANGTLTINAAAISLSGSRTYDATTNVAAGIFALSGLVNGEDLTLAGTGTVADKNVGTAKAVTLGSLALSNGTGLASNYTFTGGTRTANITAANLDVTGVTAGNKVYDANTTATLGGTAAVTAFGSDTVTVGGTGSGVFANKNVGTGKAVTVSGFTLSGADAGNYAVVQPTGVTANIIAASLAVTGLTVSNKVYDAGTTATLGGTAAITALAGDTVSLGGTASGAFADKNVGTAKAVTVSGNTISGADAGNYNLVQQTGLTANITPATLTYTATPANFTAGQTPSGLSGAVSGFVGGETMAGATTGALAWTTTAGPSSPPAQYPIDGGGLLATNYIFVQATGNAGALTLRPDTSTVIQSILVTPNVGTGVPANNDNPSPPPEPTPPPSPEDSCRASAAARTRPCRS